MMLSIMGLLQFLRIRWHTRTNGYKTGIVTSKTVLIVTLSYKDVFYIVSAFAITNNVLSIIRQH